MAEVSYLEILEEAWQQYLIPKKPNAPTIVSLFAGCGGSSLGYSMAGYRELLAVEWDKKAAATFQLNFPDVPVHIDDIHDLSVKKCLELIGLKPKELDLLDGSPPCQGFSTAGKRDLFDPRNQLYNEFARLLEGIKPRIFVMENVSGMIKGKMKLAFADCTRKLKAAGYRVSCRLMDAKWFHVPQERKRLIWMGVREDLEIVPSHPMAQAKPISASEAIGIRGIWMDGYESGMKDMDGPIPTMRAERVARIQTRSMKINKWADGPSRTLTATNSDWQMRIDGEARKPTIGEAKILSSFPPSFCLSGSFASQWRQIGNGVPPLFMRAIALHVKSLLAQVNDSGDLSSQTG